MENLNLKTIAERVASPTPVFFKKIIKLSAALVTIGAGILCGTATIKAAFGIDIDFPAWLLTIAKGMALSGFVAGLIAKTTVDDSIK